MALIRIALIFLIIYLIVRAFIMQGEEMTRNEGRDNGEDSRAKGRKKIAKNTGEYVNYEEIKKK